MDELLETMINNVKNKYTLGTNLSGALEFLDLARMHCIERVLDEESNQMMWIVTPVGLATHESNKLRKLFSKYKLS